MRDAAVADETRGHEPRRVAGNGKAESLRRQNRCRVDADHLCARRDERPAGVARVESRVGLNDVVHQTTGSGPERSPDPADDAGGCRVVEPERVADGDRHLPHPHAAGIAQVCPRQRAGIDAKDGEVRVRIVAHEITTRAPAIGQRDGQLVGLVNDVAVREDEPVGREDDARPATLLAFDAHDGG
jgi:hypothetical protein